MMIELTILVSTVAVALASAAIGASVRISRDPRH